MIQAFPWILSVALLILSVVLAINWLCTKFELDEMNELNRRLFLDHLYKKREADIRYDAKFKKLCDFEKLAYTYMCNDANELKLLIEDMVKQIGEQESWLNRIGTTTSGRNTNERTEIIHSTDTGRNRSCGLLPQV